jgi:hypothetical protein
MKGQKKAATPAEYFAQLEEPRKSEITALDALIRKAARLEPFIQMGILAYGPYRHKYPNGRENDWFRIGVASNAQYISLYVSVAAKFKEALGKANCGKSCIRFKRLSDLEPAALKTLIREAAKPS